MKRLPIASLPLALLLCGLTVGANAQTGSTPSAAPPSSAPPPSAPSPSAPSPSTRATATAPAKAAAQKGADAQKGMPAHVEDRINQMHQSLHITAAQQSAWDAFAKAMRDNADASAHAYQDRAAKLQTMTAAENLHSFAQLEQTRANGLQTLASSFDTLYSGLSDDQKKTADAMFRRQGERAAANKRHHR